MIELGKWYKHLTSPAYAQVIKVYKVSVVVLFDNSFQTTMTREMFAESFKKTTSRFLTPKGNKAETE